MPPRVRFTFVNMSDTPTPTVAKPRTQATTRITSQQAERLENTFQKRFQSGKSKDFAGMIGQMLDFCTNDPLGKDLFKSFK
jgi:hypothetical protein